MLRDPVTVLESVSRIFVRGMLVVQPWLVLRDLHWCEDLENSPKSPRPPLPMKLETLKGGNPPTSTDVSLTSEDGNPLMLRLSR
jgi:hypothetical protein